MIDRAARTRSSSSSRALGAEGASFVAVSEERGEVVFGDGGAARVVIDPIDGSLNARRTIPSHSLSIAVAAGDSMADVAFRLRPRLRRRRGVRRPRRGRGARSTAEPIGVGPGRGEARSCSASSRPSRLALAGAVESLSARSIGCGWSARSRSPPPTSPPARFDAMLSLRPCRSVDAAAAQLIVREAGGASPSASSPSSKPTLASRLAIRSLPPPGIAPWGCSPRHSSQAEAERRARQYLL